MKLQKIASIFWCFIFCLPVFAQNWVPVGAPGFSPGGASSTRLVLDSNNVPYIAFIDYANAR